MSLMASTTLVSGKELRNMVLPPDLSVVHMEYTQYYVSDGVDHPGKWKRIT